MLASFRTRVWFLAPASPSLCFPRNRRARGRPWQENLGEEGGVEGAGEIGTESRGERVQNRLGLCGARFRVSFLVSDPSLTRRRLLSHHSSSKPHPSRLCESLNGLEWPIRQTRALQNSQNGPRSGQGTCVRLALHDGPPACFAFHCLGALERLACMAGQLQSAALLPRGLPLPGGLDHPRACTQQRQTRAVA